MGIRLIQLCPSPVARIEITANKIGVSWFEKVAIDAQSNTNFDVGNLSIVQSYTHRVSQQKHDDIAHTQGPQ